MYFVRVKTIVLCFRCNLIWVSISALDFMSHDASVEAIRSILSGGGNPHPHLQSIDAALEWLSILACSVDAASLLFGMHKDALMCQLAIDLPDS